MTLSDNQMKLIQRAFLTSYVSDFSTFLKDNYSLQTNLADDQLKNRITEYHTKARRLKLLDYNRINAFIVCSFLFGEELLSSNQDLILVFQTADYDTDGMVKYIERQLKRQERG